MPDQVQDARREVRRANWEEASRDPLFLRDLEETAEAFAAADSDVSEELDC